MLLAKYCVCVCVCCQPGVRTLKRHPILAAVLWLLGGSTNEVEVPQDMPGMIPKSEVRRLRWGDHRAERLVYYYEEVGACDRWTCLGLLFPEHSTESNG